MRGETKPFWSPGTIWPPCDKGEFTDVTKELNSGLPWNMNQRPMDFQSGFITDKSTTPRYHFYALLQRTTSTNLTSDSEAKGGTETSPGRLRWSRGKGELLLTHSLSKSSAMLDGTQAMLD